MKALQEAGDNETFVREGLYIIGCDFFLQNSLFTDNLADGYGLRRIRAKPALLFITKEIKVEHFGEVSLIIKNGS